jgi:hydrogenase maturation protease
MLAIIGCGNPNRSDDGAGVVVARRLLASFQVEPVPGVQVFDTGTSGLEVMFKARGSRELILIDACKSGSEPGAIFELPGRELERQPEPAYTLHGVRWEHALYAGRKIFKDDFPERVTVYLIEQQNLELGLELSPPVARAVERVVAKVLERTRSFSVASGIVGAATELARSPS